MNNVISALRMVKQVLLVVQLVRLLLHLPVPVELSHSLSHQPSLLQPQTSVQQVKLSDDSHQILPEPQQPIIGLVDDLQ